MWFQKASPRRQAIRDDVAEAEQQQGESRQARRVPASIFFIAAVFFLGASAIQFWPVESLPYREGERAQVDLRAPVAFSMVDLEETDRRQEVARTTSPPVLMVRQEAVDHVRAQLSKLKQDVQGVAAASQLPPEVVDAFPGLTDAGVRALQGTDTNSYEAQMRAFLTRGLWTMPVVSRADRTLLAQRQAREVRLTASAEAAAATTATLEQVFTLGESGMVEEGARKAARAAAAAEFPRALVEPMANYVMGLREPIFKYDEKLTQQLAEQSARQILPAGPTIHANDVLVKRGEVITPEMYRKLREAQVAFDQQTAKEHPWGAWLNRLGRILVVGFATLAGALYVSRLAGVTRTVKQAWAVCGLLLLTLIIARAATAIYPQAAYLFGLSPTLLVTIMLVIAYNQRFALGLGALHGLLVTITLSQGVDFYMAMLAGVAAFSFGLGEIRTLGKLIEVGALAAAAMFMTVWAAGAAGLSQVGAAGGWTEAPDMRFVAEQSVWAAGAGIGVGMLALAMLRSVERTFNITTAMTLLELCDANKPLLRRLSQEAAGTFNHSLTVGIMAEAAGNAIGANGLLCRVGAYYHDVGKLSKPQYFIENQTAGGPNRHDKLSPAMSLLIIVGHVKDGIELAREYQLPVLVHQFIGQHHGTTLVEYFYHAAKKRAEQGEDGVVVSDTEFRYPGPKPQTPEAAIVMICDGCESMVRSIEEPTPGRIESAVHTMIMKRLMDGQFAECDLTLRDLGIIEETLTRTLAAIHHGRVAYPSANTERALSQPA